MVTEVCFSTTRRENGLIWLLAGKFQNKLAKTTYVALSLFKNQKLALP
jgi:hypothetical protein